MTAFLRQLASQITSPNELELRSIGERVRDILLPGYAEMKENVYVTIALVKDSNAAVGLQVTGNPTELFVGYDVHQIAPPGYYTQNDWDCLHDQAINSAGEVVQRARLLIDRGIARDQTLPVQRRRVAGPVDVVVVTDRPRLQTFPTAPAMLDGGENP